MLQARTLLTTTHDVVYIFDGVFDSNETAFFRKWMESASYRFSIPGDDLIEHRTSRALSCFPTDEQIKELGLFDSPNYKHLEKILDGRTVKRIWTNMTTYMTDCHYHVDGYSGGDLTMLYYANTMWEQSWGGETIICNRDGEPELAVACKPNRIVLFPSGLYHRVANLSTSAPPHRFVVVALYTKQNEKQSLN